MSDPVERSDALDEQLLVVKRGAVLSTRAAFGGFLVLTGLLLVVLGGIVAITLSTNVAVKDRAVLEDRNAELERQAGINEDLINQQTDAIVQLITFAQENGLTPPEIIIRSREDPDSLRGTPNCVIQPGG